MVLVRFRLFIFCPNYMSCDVTNDLSVNTMLDSPLLILLEIMFYLCYLYLFTFNFAHHYFHIRQCSCRLTITRRVSLVEQKLVTFSETSEFIISFLWGLWCLIFTFLCSASSIVDCPVPFDHCVVCPSLIYGF